MAVKTHSRALRRAKRVTLRCLAVLGVVLALLLVLVVGLVTVTLVGPSPTARDLLVTTMMETSALKFIPHLYFSSAEVETILARNSVVDSGEVTESVDFVETDDAPPKDTIELVDITEKTIPEDFARNRRIHHCYLVRQARNRR